MSYSGPFHKGELEAQAMFETTEEADYLGRRMLQPVISKTVYPFIASLPYVVVSYVNMIPIPGIAVNSSWSSILFGRPGFMSVSSDGRSVSVSNAELSQSDVDPLTLNLQSGLTIPVGLMMICFESRSRYRINGWVKAKTEQTNNGSVSFTLKVEVAFGNCPKYIQSRSVSVDQRNPSDGLKLPLIDQRSASISATQSSSRIMSLNAESTALIQQCDTFFVATYSTLSSAASVGCSFSSDISHRGGQPGFVRVLSPSTLVWPEYAGNNMFITLGNIVSNPRVGLLMIDFTNRRLLQLSGDATLVRVDNTETSGGMVMDGSSRYVQLTITEAVLTSPLLRSFTLIDRSPYNPVRSGFVSTSSSGDSASPSSDSSTGVPMSLVKVTRLSDSVASFQFSLRVPSAASVSRYTPGQFASINITLPSGQTVNRSWTITDLQHSASDTMIELTIKRSSSPSALVSRWLHETFVSVSPSEASSMWSRLERSGSLSFHFTGIGGVFSIFKSSGRSPSSASSVALSQSVVESGGRVMFVSGGIGMTPFLSVMRSLTDSKFSSAIGQLDVMLLVAFRTEEESRCMTPLLECINTINNHRARVGVHVFLSNATSSSTDGGSVNGVLTVQSRRRISASVVSQLVSDACERDVYLCGPDAFMRELSETLVSEVGVRQDRIHTEEFTF